MQRPTPLRLPIPAPAILLLGVLWALSSQWPQGNWDPWPADGSGLGASSEALASSGQHLELADLAAASAIVQEARVLGRRALRGPSGLVETEFQLAPSRVLKGSGLETWRVPGGVLEDGSGLVLAGLPMPVVGQDLLLFLGPEGGGGARLPIGLAQGLLCLTTSRAGERHVSTLGRSGTSRGPYGPILAEVRAALEGQRR